MIRYSSTQAWLGDWSLGAISNRSQLFQQPHNDRIVYPWTHQEFCNKDHPNWSMSELATCTRIMFSSFQQIVKIMLHCSCSPMVMICTPPAAVFFRRRGQCCSDLPKRLGRGGRWATWRSHQTLGWCIAMAMPVISTEMTPLMECIIP